MVPALLLAIALGVVVLGVIQHRHAQWVRRELHKNLLAHTRIVERLPHKRNAPFDLVAADRRRTRVWPQRQPAPEPDDWCDDFDNTAELRPDTAEITAEPQP